MRVLSLVLSMQCRSSGVTSTRIVSLSLWAWYNYKGVLSWVSVIWRQFGIEKSRWEFESCPLYEIRKRPLLKGWLVLQLCRFLSVTQSSSVVERLPASRRVHYQRLDYI